MYNFNFTEHSGIYSNAKRKIAFCVEGYRVSREAFIAYMEKNRSPSELAEILEIEQSYLDKGYTRAREPALL